MSDTADRYRTVATALSERVAAVPDDAWGNEAPCEGWVARDVVRHLASTAAYFLGQAGLAPPPGPDVDEDPVAAWEAARKATQAVLDDPALATRTHDSPMGRMTVEETIGQFGVADVLIHTWDLARATGLDETLDPVEVTRVYEALLPNDEMLRQGTAFGARVDVADDADPQTRLLAFTGRRP